MTVTSIAGRILGVQPELLKHTSFYNYIRDDCLAGAVGCLENAKTNDSIAHFQFYLRDYRSEVDLGGIHKDGGQTNKPAGIPDDKPSNALVSGYRQSEPPFDLEAIVIGTSDGLLVVLQRLCSPRDK
jgi:hypothetical protein